MSKKSESVWRRLAQWYGSRLGESYGPTCPPDWAAVIDECSDERLDRAMNAIRREHISFPPTLGQFETATRKPMSTGREPTPAEQLTEWIIRNKRLTQRQLLGWTWLAGAEAITGVVIHADGDSPGYRVMMNDMSVGVSG
jgi:hypothetical protein